MGISQKISQIANQVQTGVQNTTVTIFVWITKFVSALFVGFTLALIAQEMIGYGTVILSFMLVLFTGLLMRLMNKWSFGSVIVFDLICVLVALLLRTYILFAP